MRKKIVAGNWKMNTNYNQAIDLVKQILCSYFNNNVTLIIIPPFPFLYSTVVSTNNSVIQIGAQNCSKHKNGAYTGEVSAEILKSVGVKYVIVGHSERRIYFNENNFELAEKINECLNNKLIPIYCCGELLEDRNAYNYFKVVKTQIEEGLFHLTPDQIKSVVIAYEPVWAIGTGITASPEQAQEIHQFIRQLLSSKYGFEISNEISILYGGSCNAANAEELFSLPDVDGGLIGGASLKALDFVAISNSF